jgi:alpha-glucosidase
MFNGLQFKLICTMKQNRLGVFSSLLCVLPFALASRAAEVRTFNSPDARISVLLVMPEPGQKPRWSASFREKQILKECRLGLEMAGAGELMDGARIVSEKSRTVDERVPVLFGKSASARDHFNERRYTFENPNKHRVEVVFRCYNDAVAVRYELPADGREAPVTITDETTSFLPDGEPQAFVQYLESYKTSHEHQVARVPFREIKRAALIDLPLTFSWADGTYMAITEAALRQYAGMALMRGERGDDLVAKLTPRADGSKVVRPLPMKTPWRVALIADRPGALLESQTIYCLNEPNTIPDTSWIKPGKLTFHWWNGDVYDGKPGAPILSFEMAKKYIDFCAANGIEFHGMSSTEGTTTPWYHQTKPGTEPGPDTDVTRPRAGFELDRIKKYADSKGVRLWTWVHQGALRGPGNSGEKLEQAYAAFEKMGWSGMMVDFFDHDDQETVEFAEEVVKAAARHKIMVHLHGVWKPTGLERTYPNLMNHEGALNLEYLKWSDSCPPEHDLMMAFTRLIAGPMDYHLGGFRAVPRAKFKPQHVAPIVLGTRCHMLAMYVCFDNPTPMVADYPTAYIDQPGFDFLKTVPTWWDETRVLRGDIGELLITARRKGDTWYVGALSAKAPREVTLPLNFLGPGDYEMTIWRDPIGTDADPNALARQTVNVVSTGELKLRVALDGGFVARLVPTPK